jgi:hypothetical protein
MKLTGLRGRVPLRSAIFTVSTGWSGKSQFLTAKEITYKKYYKGIRRK